MRYFARLKLTVNRVTIDRTSSHDTPEEAVRILRNVLTSAARQISRESKITAFDFSASIEEDNPTTATLSDLTEPIETPLMKGDPL